MLETYKRIEELDSTFSFSDYQLLAAGADFITLH